MISDNGPDWTVFDGNAVLYRDHGLALLHSRLRPGGILTIWSATAATDYAARLATVFGPVRAQRNAVERGEPDMVYLARRAPSP